MENGQPTNLLYTQKISNHLIIFFVCRGVWQWGSCMWSRTITIFASVVCTLLKGWEPLQPTFVPLVASSSPPIPLLSACPPSLQGQSSLANETEELTFRTSQPT